MEENLSDVIEKIKDTTIDSKETKEYILAIKRVLRRACENCNSEEEETEILQEYLEEYKEDLRFAGSASMIFNRVLMYGAYKRILSELKENKPGFDTVIKEAKKMENEANGSKITLTLDIKENMISAIRYLIRRKNITKERELIEAIREERTKAAKELRSKMINMVHSSVMNLEEYGFIDEYIADANAELEQLGLSELQYVKRNPIADEQYDEQGKLVKDVEDDGVIDALSKENLEQLSIEDLEIITAFWESKFFQKRLGLSKAMSVIDTLDLWDTILHKDDEAIHNLDEDKVNGALKKDLALTYLCRNNAKITGRMTQQYQKFLEEEGISSDAQLTDEVEALLPEILRLEEVVRDVAILEGLIVYQLKNKDVKIKKWGVIKDNQEEETDLESNDRNGVTIAIENKNFRGPLVMGVPKEVLNEFFETEELDFPIYDKELDETYSSIMAKLYLPTNKFFINLVKKAYKENPNSKVLADLAGKKVKDER